MKTAETKSLLTKKVRTKIIVLYLFINILSNLVAAIIPITFSTPALQSFYMDGWLIFLNKYSTWTNLIALLTFIVPTIFCILYAFKIKGDKYYSRFINLPIAYSLIGITGWLTYFLVEIIILFAIKDSYNIFIMPIILTSSMYIILEALLSFTIAYFITETLHRKKILPKYFPDGKITEFKGTITPSLKFLFFILYISSVLFPICYLLSAIITYNINNSIPFDIGSVIVFMIVIIMGILLFIIFSDYFKSPLQKLQEGAKAITEGKYGLKVNVVSNDSFGMLADAFNEMSLSLDEKTKRIFKIQDSIITGMAMMVESRDNSTGGHIKRTSECIKIFVTELKNTPEFSYLSENFCQSLIKAAPMHDLGKIAVDDAILRKPGKFTNEEYEMMKKHSAEGAKIIKKVLSEADDDEFKKIAINVAHYHHEKYNGTGYPEGIKENEIPLESRIMALADVFDALVSKRCYKDTFSYDKAFSIIQESLGTHFDPSLGKIFISCRTKLESLYDSQYNQNNEN